MPLTESLIIFLNTWFTDNGRMKTECYTENVLLQDSPKHLGFVGLNLENKLALLATTYLVFQAKNLVYFRGRGLIKFVRVTSVLELDP